MSPAAPRPALSLAAPARTARPDGSDLSLDRHHARAACVAVANPMIAAALSVTAQRQGWQTRPVPEPGAVLITDRLPPSSTGEGDVDAVVLVCDPTPFAARRAVDAVAALRVTAVVRADQPDDLRAALACLEEERGSIPRTILSLAAQMPEVNQRQVALLGAVLAGQTTSQMARGLHLSPASVKRELGALSRSLDATTRAALLARALELGVQPLPLRP